MPVPAPEWWKRIARNRLLDVGLLTITLICVARIAALLPSRAVDIDFSHYYISSRLVSEGRDPYQAPLYSLYAQYGFLCDEELLTASNPPALLWLLAPLTLLSPTVAFWFWVAAQVACLVAVLALTRQLIGRRFSVRAWQWFCCGVLASAPVYWHFCFSQTQLLMAALLLSAYAMHQRGRYLLACLLVSVAGLLKLYPLALLPWFVWRTEGQRWRSALVCAVALGLGVVATGPALWSSFLERALPAVTQWGLNRATYTVPAFLVNVGAAGFGFLPPPDFVALWWKLGTIAGALLLAGSYVWCWRNAGDREAEFCLLTVVMVICGVTAWIHYLVLVIFPLGVWLARGGREMTLGKAVGCVALLFLLNDAGKWGKPTTDWSPYVVLFVRYATLYGLVWLGGYFAAQLRRRA